ncbi:MULTISPECIES: YwhD family protein [unclassified Exiguobacterium]|uniref:YwhD family protein n=1 Tax=unclassified Exiguobacterium TaxID=2644629 RepID=UPI001BE5FF69|nr:MULTISPECIES: YwhD family protein [unclassified Exiguobacterium]
MKEINFNIVADDSTDGHGGFGVGSLSLNNMSPVIIDVEAGTAVIDMGAMHAKSAIEKRIKFLTDPEAVPNGKPYWIVWVTVGRKPEGFYYGGVAACDMSVDLEARRGYKLLPYHVNQMDKSLKGHILIDMMDAPSRNVLAAFLKEHRPEIWEQSTELQTELARLDAE